jgi:DNA-binding Lrp family transcriptional regulator
MSPERSQFEIELLKKLQEPLPVCERPFAEVARAFETNEKSVLEAIARLKASGVIRRFRAHISYRTLGRIASLVTAHVPHEKFDAVADAVSRLHGVSHNYVREHHYNLWFTLQASSLIAIGVTLDSLRDEFDMEFHSLPAVRLFKLSFHLDPAGPVPAFLCAQDGSSVKNQPVSDIPPVPVELSAPERAVLSCIQEELPLTECPFESFRPRDVKDVYSVLESLRQKGVLSRFSAVPDYTKLGYAANALFCLEVPESDITAVGTSLAAYNLISHCYQRQTFSGWPFNLYAMCHAGEIDTIAEFAQQFCRAHTLQNYQLLPTVAELKKEPVKITG